MMAMETRVIDMMSGRRCRVVRSPTRSMALRNDGLIDPSRPVRLLPETPRETHSETDLSHFA